MTNILIAECPLDFVVYDAKGRHVQPAENAKIPGLTNIGVSLL
jgi:hypothetical protein